MRFQFATAVCFLVALLCLIALGCSKAPMVVAPEAPKVTVMHPEQRELSDHEEFNGWMAADDKVEVRARVKGHIKKIDFTDGQYVKKGDLLFKLGDKELGAMESFQRVRSGLAYVPQGRMIFPALSVVETIYAGAGSERKGPPHN